MKFYVPDPCSEKWADMLPTERGAFCAVCSKNIHDFSRMSDAEIREVIRSSSGKACGFFRKEQLFTPTTLSEVTITAERNKNWLRRFMYALWIVFGSSLFSCAPDEFTDPAAQAQAARDSARRDSLENAGLAPGTVHVKRPPLPAVLPMDTSFEPPMDVTGGVVEEPPILVENYPYPPETPNADSVLSISEIAPEFPGGEGELRRFVGAMLVYPDDAKAQNVEGLVVLSFVVHTDGHVGEVKVVKSIGSGCDEAAMDVVKSMPRWTPGRMNGRPVPTLFHLPVRFRLK